MKKAVDFLKNNKAIVIISAIIIALIILVVTVGGGNASISVGTSDEKSKTELKLEQILSSIEGVGDSNVMINEGADGIEGVIIVCRGAGNIMVRNDIINAVATALNIQKNIIAVYAMN